MKSRSNVERASVLFQRRDELIVAAKLVLNGNDHRLTAARKKDAYAGFEPRPFVSLAVINLGDDFKRLVVAELRAQIENIQRELRSLDLGDDIDIDSELGDAASSIAKRRSR